MSRAVAMTIIGAMAATLSGASIAAAEPAAGAALSRLEWAKRHVELVCRPLEASGAFDRATRCYNDVTRLVGDLTKTALPSASSYPPAPKVAAKAAPKPAARIAAVRTAPARRAAQRTITVASADAAPFPFFQPAPAATARCSGISCIQRYTLLGVGF